MRRLGAQADIKGTEREWSNIEYQYMSCPNRAELYYLRSKLIFIIISLLACAAEFGVIAQ
jgi:hypothetical protein